MAIPLTGGSGAFNLFGKALGVIGVGTTLTAIDANYYRGTNLLAKFNALDTVYSGMSGNLGRQSGSWVFPGLSSMQANVGQYLSTIGRQLQTSLIQMANDSLPLPSNTNANAVNALITSMNSSTATVASSTITLGTQTAVGTVSGNPVITFSALQPTGLAGQYIYSDTYTFACTSDSATGATAGRETLSVVGNPAVTDTYSNLWPGGLSVNTSTTAVDATANNSSTGNLLSNSDFETWTGYPGAPDNWNILVGSAGTDVIRGTSAYTGSYDLQLTSGSTSTTLASVAQTFGTATSPLPGGTPQTLSPGTVYALNFVYKVTSVPAAGVLKVDLIDGSNAVINDPNGVANSTTIALTGATTSYATKQAFFRTPTPPTALPSTIKLRVSLSTAIDTGKSVHVDHLALTPATRLYTGGPYFAVFSMSSAMLKNDTWTFGIATTWGLFQQGFERIFGMRTLGLTLPNSATPTIADSLIV